MVESRAGEVKGVVGSRDGNDRIQWVVGVKGWWGQGDGVMGDGGVQGGGVVGVVGVKGWGSRGGRGLGWGWGSRGW